MYMWTAPGCRGFLAIAPGPKIHHRLYVQHRGVEILRITAVHSTHRIGVRLIASRAICRTARVALRERVNVLALPLACARFERNRLLHELQRPWLFVRLHERIDVWTEHERLTPVRHCQIWIESRGLAERASGFRVIEGIRQIQALIHESLCFAISGRHSERVIPEILKPRRKRSGCRLLLLGFDIVHVAAR
jgi:hypothetical protein